MAVVLGLSSILEKEESPSLQGAEPLPNSHGAALLQEGQDIVSITTNDTDTTPATPDESEIASPAILEEGQVIVSATTNDIDTTVATLDGTESETLPPTLMPTRFPTLMPSYDLPTDVPTAQKFSSQSFLFSSHSFLRSKEIGVRLKLYWEGGYYWQEKKTETWWCMACPGKGGECKEDDKPELRDCENKSDLDAQFVVTHRGNKNHQFRVANTNLCLDRKGKRRIRLKSCKDGKTGQLFKTVLGEYGEEADDKFDLRPVGMTDRCLTNHHHPKAGEVIYAAPCKKAHGPDTGYWVAY
ncbi:hypothetical protein ACHAWF_017430 [Thalassiosira exigua]